MPPSCTVTSAWEVRLIEGCVSFFQNSTQSQADDVQPKRTWVAAVSAPPAAAPPTGASAASEGARVEVGEALCFLAVLERGM